MVAVSSFVSLLASFASLMTSASFENFKVLANGWVLSTRKRTVTELIQRAGAVDRKSFATFHRFASIVKMMPRSRIQRCRMRFSLPMKLCPSRRSCGPRTP